MSTRASLTSCHTSVSLVTIADTLSSAPLVFWTFKLRTGA